MNPNSASPLRPFRGFTLIELMVVVVILGILAAVAVPAFTRAKRKARTKDVDAMFAAIATAQETYHQFNGDYYGSMNAQGPVPTSAAQPWGLTASGTTLPDLQVLGITATGDTWFQYFIGAGSGPGCTFTAANADANGDPCGALTTSDWWWAAAVGNQDGDTHYSTFVTHSNAGGQIWRSDEAE